MKKFIIPAVAVASVAVVAVVAVVIAVFTGGGKEDVYRLIKVNSFEGTVTVQREEKMDAFEGLQLVSEDLVEVGNQSLLELLADSDKHIVAEADTSFRLHSTGTETSGNITIDLLYGKSLFTIENKLSEESFFSVKTPNATLSVRGTTFEVSYDPQTETTVVKVTEGIVAVVSDVLTDDLTAGESAVIRNEETVESTEPTEEVTVETQQATAETAETTETAETAESMLEPLFFEHTEDVAFNIRYSDLTTYSGLHAKHLNGFITPIGPDNVPFPSFDSLNDKSTLMYMALTADEAQQKKADLESKGYKIHTLVNGDGDTIEVVKFNYSGGSHTLPMPDGSPSISAVAVSEQGYEYFKKVTDDLYLSISVSLAKKEQFETTDINSYIQLTQDEFYILSFSTEPLNFEAGTAPAFNIRRLGTNEYSGVIINELVDFMQVRSSSANPDGFINKDNTLIYLWVMTKTEMDQERIERFSNGYEQYDLTLKNRDRQTVEFVKCDFKEDKTMKEKGYGVVREAFQFYKEVTDELYLSILVCPQKDVSLDDTLIESYLQLTEERFYTYSLNLSDRTNLAVTDSGSGVILPAPAPQTTPAPVLVPVPEEEYPDNSSTGGLVTIPLAEFESDYVEEIIELTAENASEYFEAAENNGSLYFALKPGYASYGDGYNVETDYVSFSTTALGGERYNFALSEDEDIQKQMNINRASGSIVKYNIPDDMWLSSGNNYIVYIENPDGSLHILIR